MTAERLQKILAAAGAGSRRQCEQLIQDGRVAVDGTVVTELGTKADPATVRITLDGKPVQAATIVCLALHKPRGYVSTKRDSHASRTVMNLLPERFHHLYPVGRLDAASEGLLLMTNDGAIAERLTHPRYQVPKTYRVTVDGIMAASSLSALRSGVELEDGLTLPADVNLIEKDRQDQKTRFEITIREGRNRQIRRMCEAVGHEVVRLVRVAFGPVTLTGIPGGKYRQLEPSELEQLKSYVPPR